MLTKPDDRTNPATTITVTVARGRSIFLDGRTYGPGEEVAIPAADYPHTLAGGFIIDPNDTSPPPIRSVAQHQASSNPAHIGLQSSTEA
jgi:hypothetical protein